MLAICENDRVYIITFPGVDLNAHRKLATGNNTIIAKDNQRFFRAKSEPSCLVCSFNKYSKIPRYLDLFRYDENLIEKGTKINEDYLFNKVFPYMKDKIASSLGFLDNKMWWNDFLFAQGDKAYIVNADGVKRVFGYTSHSILSDSLTAVMKACPNYSIEDKVKEFIKIQENHFPENFYPFLVTDTLTNEIRVVDKDN